MKNLRLARLASVLLAGCVLMPQMAVAAGYALREHSADAMGTAYAGSAATGTDASYLVYNPASLGLVDDSDYSLSVAGILPDTSSHYTAFTSAGTPITNGPSSPGGFVSNAAVPALGARWRVDDRWALGLSVSAPWGLMTTYPQDWVGRYYGVDTKLTTINIQPLVSFAVTPHFIIAAGPQAQYADGTFTNAIDVGTITALGGGTPGSIAEQVGAHFHATGWGWGWTAGALAQLSDNFSVGVSYRSSVATTASGHLNFSNVAGNPFAAAVGIFADTPAKTSLTTPDIANLGARWRICDDWTLLGETDWTRWSVFKNLVIRPGTGSLVPPDVTPTDWHDTWFFGLGAEYRASDRWTLKAGTAFDESPVPNSTKGPRIPDSDRTWLSVGARYHATNSLDVSFSAAHLFLADSKVDLSHLDPGTASNPFPNALRGDLAGSAGGSVNVIALQFSYHP